VISKATVVLINQIMKHDSMFRFARPFEVIAFVCDLSVDLDALCEETYINFYRQFTLDLS
jgi:hypothetical protein